MGKKNKKNNLKTEKKQEIKEEENNEKNEENNEPIIKEEDIIDPEREMAQKEEEMFIEDAEVKEEPKEEKDVIVEQTFEVGNNLKEENNIPKLHAAKKINFAENKNIIPYYDVDSNYFYQEIDETEWNEIKNFLVNYINKNNRDINELNEFFNAHPFLNKGGENSQKLLKIVQEINFVYEKLDTYKFLLNSIINQYFNPKPSLLECYFFPNRDNEIYVVNMLRTCKKTLDIAIFSLTNDRIAAAIEEAFKRNVKIRIIADDTNSRMLGSDIMPLAVLGIPVKTDKSSAYMHHKFAIIDESVVVTGSFNWSEQAVKSNQENILFYENKELAKKYTDAFNNLWNDRFKDNQIEMSEAKEFMKQYNDNLKKAKEEKEAKQKEKEKIAKEKEKEKIAKEKEKEKIAKQKEKEKIAKQKEKEKIAKQKEKEKIAKQKEKEKIAKQKEKEKAEKEKAKKLKEKAREKINKEKSKSKTKKTTKK